MKLFILIFVLFLDNFQKIELILKDIYEIDEDFKISLARKKKGIYPTIKGCTFVDKKNQAINIALTDLNDNGVFGDEHDLVHVSNSKYKKVHISNITSNHVTNYKPNMILEIENIKYKLNIIDPHLPKITLEVISNNKSVPDLVFSSLIPNLNLFEMHTSKKMNLRKLSENNKYTVFYFFGTWCTGCVQQTKKIKEFNSNYSCNVKFIFMNFNDGDDKVGKYVKENNITNFVFISNESTNKMFSVAMFPTFALYKNGQHVLNSISIDEIERQITITK